ncbi:50S ribosomal protein L23 [Candidatus Nomurabacteria bacterium]|nr:50S ribosomal protein L23 [Candidatus Nomurabacteria bacterium]
MATTKTKIKEVKVKEVKNNSVILGPRITEKSALGSEKGRYTFNVATNTNKSEVVKAIKAMYKVTPVKISITIRKEKTTFRGGRLGTKSGGKKAVVYLKKGDKIAFA